MRTFILVLLSFFLPVLVFAQIVWVEHSVIGSFGQAKDSFAADVDGDGDMDVLGVTGHNVDTIAWFENVGDNENYIQHTIDNQFNTPTSVYAADIDGDGDTDILGTANADNDIVWWENLYGDGLTLIEHVVDGGFAEPSDALAADLDGDGDMDVLASGYTWSTNGYIHWWENLNGDGLTWTERVVDGNYCQANQVSTADMDGDGDLDVLSASLYFGVVTWWENLGEGLNWAEHLVASTVGGYPFAADMDGDGDNDILGTTLSYDVAWWENMEGNGLGWNEHSIEDSYEGGYKRFAADVDNDGDTDVICTSGILGQIAWWENLDGSGIAWSEYMVVTNNSGFSLSACDMDGDGDTDVLGSEGSRISWWEQEGPPVPVVVTLVPAANPVIVPRGASFSYDLIIAFNLTQTMFGVIWSEAILPGGTTYGPVYNTAFLFAPGMTINVQNIQQVVPAYAPLGDYSWVVNAGPSMAMPVGSDSFPFTVISTAADAQSSGIGWESVGHERIAESSSGRDPSGQITEIPTDFGLLPAQPNPFNSSTTVTVALPSSSNLTVTVYNTLGQEVAQLANGPTAAGTHAFTFDASDLSSGIYFVQATVPGQIDALQKVVLVK